VIDWFGDWSHEALWQVAREFTLIIDPPEESFTKQSLKDNLEARHDTLVNSIVYIHNSVVEINKKLRKAAKKFNFITPRDFLDFIKHFIELHKGKKEKLEEQQYHLNLGLGKLKETEETVLELQKSLDKYKNELEIKEKEANVKLNLMVQKQKEAESKRESAIILSKEIDSKQVVIQEKTKYVEKELSEAEPALIKAKDAVSNIKQSNLVEMRSLKSPPHHVKFTLEAVLSVILGKYRAWDWKDVQKEISKQGFIQTVMNFDTDSLPANVKDSIRTNYLNNSDWDVDRIYKASQAAGPLAMWVESQLKYADILKNIRIEEAAD
jgi:dynein heavy chain 1